MAATIQTEKKTGAEAFSGLNRTLLDYWAWAHSDIAANAERGRLAEYLVACAVNSPTACRTEWDTVDVVSADGIKIEVKSAAYLQAWQQSKYSAIRFDIAPKREWFYDVNTYSDEVKRHADVYVFCLFACKEAALANPMDLTQWEFYVLPTAALNEKAALQKTASLTTLQKLGAAKCSYNNLCATIHALFQQ